MEIRSAKVNGERKGSAVMGFLIGLLAGAAAMLLYAPKSGDLTREELRLRSDELRRRADELERVARDLAGQAQVKGRDLAGQAHVKGRELADEAKRQWEGASKRSGTGEGGPNTRA